jgi:hypothetical protein
LDGGGGELRLRTARTRPVVEGSGLIAVEGDLHRQRIHGAELPPLKGCLFKDESDEGLARKQFIG